jgi:hypothetical protein
LQGVLLVYSERVPGATDFDLFAQRVSTNGRARGAPKLIVGGPGDQKQADVTVLSRGDWLVVWSEDTKDAGDIMGLRLSRALTARGKPFPVAQGTGTAEEPVIGRDPTYSGYYLVLWTDDRNGNKDIYGTRLTDSGLPRSGPTKGHFKVIDTPEDDYGAALVLSSSGRRGELSLVLWTHDDVTDGPDVLGQRLRSNGLPVGPNLKVAAGPGVQSYPAARAKGSDWLTVWQDDELGTLDIVGVELASNGLSRRHVRGFAAD